MEHDLRVFMGNGIQACLSRNLGLSETFRENQQFQWHNMNIVYFSPVYFSPFQLAIEGDINGYNPLSDTPT